MSLADGVTVNHNLLAIINDLHGKEILLETKDGRQFLGLLSGCSPELELGVKYVYERTDENVDYLFPKGSETKEKMSFQFADVIAISALIAEDKFIKGFATDRDYHCAKLLTEDDDLQAWEGDEDEGCDEIENTAHLSDQKSDKFQKNSAGWSVDEMFSANKKFGVQSTYEDDMSQYTTADIVGTEKERAEADRIAKEIEKDSRSKYYSHLENDDDERDLDKATKDDDFDIVGKKQRGGNNNRTRGAANQTVNRRAEATKGSDRRNLNSKYESGKGQNSTKPFVPSQHVKRPTGAEVQEQFNEFAQREVNKKDTHKTDQTRVTKILLEHKNGATHTEKTEKSASKIDDLKQWSKDFNEVYIDSKPVITDEKEGIASRVSVAQPGNAWNKGPPTSLVTVKSSSPSNAQIQPSTVESPQPPAEKISQLEESTLSCSEMAGVATEHNETVVDNLSNCTDNREDATSTSSVKKFSFNPNAPAFTPRLPTTSATVNNSQSSNPSQIPSVPMGFPPGVTVPATMSAQVVAVTGPVVSQWQGSQNQFQQVPVQFQQYQVPGTPIMAPVTMIPPRGPNQATQMYQGQNSSRRAQMPPTSAPMIMPANAQWANQPVMVPYQGGYQYQTVPQAGPAAAPPQAYSVSNGQTVIPQANMAVYQQQRFGSVGYVYHPNGQRYATGQQGLYSMGNEASVLQGQYPQPPQVNNSGAAGSQPTTPGPQPQPVSSPAQIASTTSGVTATRGSPSPAPPPSQQFSHAPPQPMVAPQYYNNVYMYAPLYPQNVTMGHPMVHNGEQHHMDGLMTAPQGQHFSHHDQYGNMIPAQGGVFYQAQGSTSQPMSRQNSLPHSGFVGNQPGIQNQQLIPGPQSTQSSSASQQQ